LSKVILYILVFSINFFFIRTTYFKHHYKVDRGLIPCQSKTFMIQQIFLWVTFPTTHLLEIRTNTFETKLIPLKNNSYKKKLFSSVFTLCLNGCVSAPPPPPPSRSPQWPTLFLMAHCRPLTTVSCVCHLGILENGSLLKSYHVWIFVFVIFTMFVAFVRYLFVILFSKIGPFLLNNVIIEWWFEHTTFFSALDYKIILA